ncbi:MAG: IclR family transcriptional regulator [Microthrixaceae bacterium]|nr:IclR family transcriptional regulator [Microthrixaceae bacterium]
MEYSVSGVGVLDKSVSILASVGARPMALGELVDSTGLTRATVHRLAVALEAHGLLRRDSEGNFALGPNLIALGRSAVEQLQITEAAARPMEDLRTKTGESVQLYVRDRDSRVCISALESPHGLRTIVPLGAVLPIDRGSAGRVLEGEVERGAWVDSVGERESGVASVSAPVMGPDGLTVLAAVSVSGPIDRMGSHPGAAHGQAVADAAKAIEVALQH